MTTYDGYAKKFILSTIIENRHEWQNGFNWGWLNSLSFFIKSVKIVVLIRNLLFRWYFIFLPTSYLLIILIKIRKRGVSYRSWLHNFQFYQFFRALCMLFVRMLISMTVPTKSHIRSACCSYRCECQLICRKMTASRCNPLKLIPKLIYSYFQQF